MLNHHLLKERFETDGAVWPLPVFDEARITKYRAEVEKAESELHLMGSDYRCKSQVLFPWLDEIVHDEALGDIVEAVIGPNFHCWDTLFWLKEPGDEKYVSYHQDATYWNFAPKTAAMTVWLAFSDATAEAGAINYALGSHRLSQLEHVDKKHEHNLLMRGQTIAADIDAYERAVAEVPAGHVSVHAPFIVHGSPPNRSKFRRIACGMIFASTACKPVATFSPESTVMVRGVDTYNYMQHDPRPIGDWKSNETAWRAAYDRQHENYYKMNLQHAEQAASSAV